MHGLNIVLIKTGFTWHLNIKGMLRNLTKKELNNDKISPFC